MREKIRQIAMAGLLHDVGKICYRTGREKGDHSNLGAQFLAGVMPAGPLADTILACVKNHHAAHIRQNIGDTSHMAYLIYEADNIAAGTDRRQEEQDGAAVFDKHVPLESIFNRLNGISPDKRAHYLRGFEETGHISYPVSGRQITAPPDKYDHLLSLLKDNLRQTDFDYCSVNELLKIMEGVASFIPSSTNTKEACDISLYDHVKLTAAIACCMEAYFQDKSITDYAAYCMGDKNAVFREEGAFLMVSGDLSGIQDFIYTIPSSGALKSLRGRSFYLDLLMEHIADELLEELGLNRANLIYAGGGHFYLLAAHTKDAEEILRRSAAAINDWLLAHTGISLYLQLAWVPCCANDLMNPADDEGIRRNRTGDVFRRLSAQLAEGKLRRYNPQQLAEVFAAHSPLNITQYAAQECSVCHTSSTELVEYEGKPGMQACPFCSSLYLFGRRILEQTGVFCVTTGGRKGLPLPSLAAENCRLELLSVQDAADRQKLGQIRRLYTKNSLQTGRLLGTHLWVGDYAARDDDGAVKDFSELVKAGGGIQRLGVMRADIDSLGAAFVAGFAGDGKNPYQFATLSRTAALSRQLSLFFKRYINHICQGRLRGDGPETYEPYSLWGQTKQERQAAIVYAGGDDMFIVGAWEDIIEMAVDLYRAFDRFACGKLTFSAGIALFGHAFPVGQMANLTGKLEGSAKGLDGKNAIALFGIDDTCREAGSGGQQHIYRWSAFTGGVLGDKLAFLQDTLSVDSARGRVVCRGSLPCGKSHLYRLLELFDPGRQGEGRRMNIARLAYMLARMEPSGPPHDSPPQQCYRRFREQVYRWYADSEHRRQFSTALHLLIYGLRDQEK